MGRLGASVNYLVLLHFACQMHFWDGEEFPLSLLSLPRFRMGADDDPQRSDRPWLGIPEFIFDSKICLKRCESCGGDFRVSQAGGHFPAFSRRGSNYKIFLPSISQKISKECLYDAKKTTLFSSYVLFSVSV